MAVSVVHETVLLPDCVCIKHGCKWCTATETSITIFMSKSFDVLVAVHHLQPYGNQALVYDSVGISVCEL